MTFDQVEKKTGVIAVGLAVQSGQAAWLCGVQRLP